MRVKLELTPNEFKIVKDALKNNYTLLKELRGINHKEEVLLRREREDMRRLFKKLDIMPEEGTIE